MCGSCKEWECVCVVLVMCGCFDNMYNCIYCVFVLFRLCIFILICFVRTSVRTTATEWQSQLVIIIMIILLLLLLNRDEEKCMRKNFVRVAKDFVILYIINWLVLITVVESVYSAVRTDSLYKADYAVRSFFITRHFPSLSPMLERWTQATVSQSIYFRFVVILLKWIVVFLEVSYRYHCCNLVSTVFSIILIHIH